MSPSSINSPALGALVVGLPRTCLVIGRLGLELKGRAGTIILRSRSDVVVQIFVEGSSGFHVPALTVELGA